MFILGIETSCDETSASVIEGQGRKIRLLSNVVSSSLSLHSKTGGIIPETAAREQVKLIIPVINQAMEQSNNETMDNIDAIAVTVGPGLVGSLLVGVETAKVFSFVFKKPIIPVNHLIGHIYANWITQEVSNEKNVSNVPKAFDTSDTFPALALVVSGGHTDLVLLKKHGDIKWLGGTRDDAAGEAFDKIGRLLSLPYPGGPAIEKAAMKGDSKAFSFPRPMLDSNDFDFSFSGLKTAVLREISLLTSKPTSHFSPLIPDLAASVQKAIVDVLVVKTLKAAKKYKVKSILLGGGVAANEKLRKQFELEIRSWKLEIPFFVPEKWLCTDNAAMIAAAAFFNFNPKPWQKVEAVPELYFD